MIYTFKYSVEAQEDGRWSAWLDSLPHCCTWGYSRAEALEALTEAAHVFLQDMHACGEEIPVEDNEALGALI